MHAAAATARHSTEISARRSQERVSWLPQPGISAQITHGFADTWCGQPCNATEQTQDIDHRDMNPLHRDGLHVFDAYAGMNRQGKLPCCQERMEKVTNNLKPIQRYKKKVWILRNFVPIAAKPTKMGARVRNTTTRLERM